MSSIPSEVSQPRVPSAPLETVNSSGQHEIQRVKPIHDAMIDLIIAKQGVISRTELAKHFGYTPVWVGRLMNSDSFQARLAVRKADLVDPLIVASVEEKFRSMIDRSLDILEEKLDKAPTSDLALQTLALGAKALGYGARQQNVQLQQNFVVAMPEKASSSSDWVAKHGATQTVVEAETKIVPPAQGSAA